VELKEDLLDFLEVCGCAACSFDGRVQRDCQGDNGRRFAFQTRSLESLNGCKEMAFVVLKVRLQLEKHFFPFNIALCYFELQSVLRDEVQHKFSISLARWGQQEEETELLDRSFWCMQQVQNKRQIVGQVTLEDRASTSFWNEAQPT
jgi:hypothetical protein